MKNTTHVNKPYAIAATGLASAAALFAGADDANAENMYFGLSYGVVSGTPPLAQEAEYPDDYELNGGTGGFFVGRDFGGGGSAPYMGLELAYSAGVDGDPNEETSYSNAYDLNWMLDAKLRIGGDISTSVRAYGFVGFSSGSANNYYTDYAVSGTNFGFGAEMDMQNGMFVGIEAIQRNISNYGDPSNNRAVTLRAGFKF